MVWYERVTAIKLTQKNKQGELESRFFSQIERTEEDYKTGDPKSEWLILGDSKYFLSEIEAINHAIAYRDRDGKKYL